MSNRNQPQPPAFSRSRDRVSSNADPLAGIRNLEAACASSSRVDPFAALRNLEGARASTALDECATTSLGSEGSTPTAASRRPLESEKADGQDEGPLQKKKKVSNTVVRLHAPTEPCTSSRSSQTVGDRLNKFLKWAPKAAHALFGREEGPSASHTCQSGLHDPQRAQPIAHNAEEPIWFRCFDCYHAPIVCEACMGKEHTRMPFHRVETWLPTRRFWQRRYLSEVANFAINLGHGGERCDVGGNARKLTITHDHGINDFLVHFCACPDRHTLTAVEEPIQLLSYGLFPGTWAQPRAAFTINGLRDYHLLSLQAQISAHDYIKYLQRTTDNVAADLVPVRTLLAKGTTAYTRTRSGTGQRAQQYHAGIHVPPHHAQGRSGTLVSAGPTLGFYQLPCVSPARHEHGSELGEASARPIVSRLSGRGEG